MYNGNPRLFVKTCNTCSVEFVGGPTAKFCPECRAERIRQRDNKRHATGPARKLGSVDLCKRCGKKYEVIGGHQKFCADCSKLETSRRKAESFAKRYADPSKRDAMFKRAMKWAKAHPKRTAQISHIYWIKKGKIKRRLRTMARKNIYMNPPLDQLWEETKPGKFSQRIGDVVERYNVIMKLTDLPEFTEDETMILSEVICGSAITLTMIKSMHWAVMDAQGDTDTKKALADKIEQLSPAARIKLIESLGQ